MRYVRLGELLNVINRIIAAQFTVGAFSDVCNISCKVEDACHVLKRALCKFCALFGQIKWWNAFAEFRCSLHSAFLHAR